MRKRWVHLYGNGLVYAGPCLLHDVIVTAPTAGDTADVYDGRDATSGKKFASVVVAANLTWQVTMPEGVPFDRGIYIDAADNDVETTVVFTPV